MIEVSDEQFQQLIDEALNGLPGEHVQQLENVAILFDEDPTPEQRHESNLRPNQTLLGLYEGVPLADRQGMTPTLPDRITLFKGPLSRQSNSLDQLKEEISHTLWHEIAHYFGLNHDDIAAKE
jgi:predicted Zn-dependent protease with MMP-like domain